MGNHMEAACEHRCSITDEARGAVRSECTNEHVLYTWETTLKPWDMTLKAWELRETALEVLAR